MNAIMGMSVIAQANLNAPEKVHDCLDKINVSSRHLLSLINEILDMSKIESGKIDLVEEVVELPELLQNVCLLYTSIQKGTLHKGDCVIAGTAVGRVRTMKNDKGQYLEAAGPSTPVEITGPVSYTHLG